MPNIFQAEELTVTTDMDGWTITHLADTGTFNYGAMVSQRWSFRPGARSAVIDHDGKERFLYVISGSGTAHVNGEPMEMDDEAVLWLELGDRYFFEAGPNGLELLMAFAPGD